MFLLVGCVSFQILSDILLYPLQALQLQGGNATNNINNTYYLSLTI